MARLPQFKVPRPTKFLGLLSLRNGTQLILLAHVINKVTGFYGILALFTGYPISWLQLSMYIYSLIALFITLYLAPHLKTGSAWHCIAFAQLYAIDSVINAAYTVFFTVAWFMVLAANDHKSNAPGAKTMEATSGFTSPQYNVTHVVVAAVPASGLNGQDAIAAGHPAASNVSAGEGLFTALMGPGSMMSLFIICAFWALRFYAIFVVMAYARQMLHHHIQVSSTHNYNLYDGSRSSDLAENPFEEHKEDGQAWKGKLGRVMVGLGPKYWLGRDEEDDIWMRNMGSKFRKNGEQGLSLGDRERRRRTGTGPPKPASGLASP